MKFISSLVLVSASCLLTGLTGTADARLSKQMVERAVVNLEQNVGGDHLHLLSKKDTPAHDQHRRHHKKRGTCSSGSSSGSSSSGSSSGASASVKAAYAGASSSQSASSSASSSGNVSPLASSSNSSSSSSSSSSASGSASALGSISGFQGTNTGIGSWFRTNSGQDSTNGRSWCQLNYQDSWMGFAPSVGTMLNNFGGSTDAAGKAYCGREVKATNPNNGNTALIYIVDGFDDKWVRTPGSIDLTVAAFTALYGSFDGNKNTVIQNLQWEFTGNVKEEYTFNYGS